MGQVNEILSAMRKGPELMAQVNAVKLNTKSIARGAKDATFQFPCLISDSAPVDMANTIARTLDHVYASFTQTWLSMNSMYDITIDPTPLAYLKKIHQNFKLESAELEIDESDIEEYLEKVYDGSYRMFMDKSGSYAVLFNVSDRATRSLMESHKDLLSEHLSEFNMEPLEKIVTEAPIGAGRGDLYDFTNAVINGEVSKNKLDREKIKADISSKGTAPKLLDRDVKRSNDLVPYAIQVRMMAVNSNKEFVQYVDFVLGIKTILHLVESSDMCDNIVRALQNQSLLFRFLRWTTGEISLIKDLIFNIDDLKTDAVNSNSGKSPFFSTLKRLKHKKIGVSNLTVPHSVIPNATIVVTSYEVDYLREHHGINLRKETIVRKLMDQLFLMSFIILDEGTNTVSVLYDGDSLFQTYALETLERDNALNSNKLSREIGRMIAH